jgi:hypothetical protein
MGDTHIVSPMSEITHAFDHLLTQLALVGLKVKVSKCKFWNPLRIFLGIKILQGYTLVRNGLCILSLLVGSQDFAMHFLDEVLFYNMAHIDDLPLLRDVQVTLGILSSCSLSTFLFHMDNFFFPSFLSLLMGFNKNVM